MRALIVLICLLSSQAWATDRYAAVGGLTTGQCDSIGIACTVRQCITAGTNGETCYIAPGTYPAAELGASNYVIETSEFVNLVCSGAVGSCIFQPTGANVSGIRLNSPPTGTMVITGIKIDGSTATPLDQCFYYSDGAAAYSVTSTDNTCTEADIYGHRIVANEMTLTSLRDTLTASTAVEPRSFVFTAGTWAEGGVSVDAANVTIDKYTTHGGSVTPIMNILAADAGETGSVTNSTFNITNDPAALTGYIDVIRFIAIPSAIASGNNITVRGANVGSAKGPACDAAADCRHVRAIKSYSTSALDSSGFIADDNAITIEAANGVMIAAGDDGTSAGDTYSANGRISNNTLTCTNTGTSFHGVMFAWSQGGRGYGNKVIGCGIGLLSKGQPTQGALFSGNILEDIWESYAYAKGSVGARFLHNNFAVSNTTGIPLVNGVDGATNSTNTQFYNNSIFSTNGSTPANLVNTASSQTLAAADGNNWFGFTDPQWTYLGVAYTSLAAWNAVGVVGTDLAVDPDMVGGIAPSTWGGYRLGATSGLRRAGKDLNIGNYQDCLNRAFHHPPSVGACEAASGDAAAARTAR